MREMGRVEEGWRDREKEKRAGRQSEGLSLGLQTTVLSSELEPYAQARGRGECVPLRGA